MANDDVSEPDGVGNEDADEENLRRRGRPKTSCPSPRVSVNIWARRKALRIVRQDAKAKGYSLGRSLDWFVRTHYMQDAPGSSFGDVS